MPIPSWLVSLSGYTPAAKATNNRREDGRFGFLSRAFGFLTSSEGAAQIGSDPEATGLAADNVSDALAELAARLGGGNIVVWAPDAESDGPGYYSNWADVVNVVQQLVGNTIIKILWSPNGGSDPVVIPGGTWELNNTILEGVAYGADTDTSYRGSQELVYVVGEDDNSNPVWLKSCIGVRNLFWRQQDFENMRVNGSAGTVAAKDGDTITFTTNGDWYTFTSKDVGKPIRVGWITPYTNYGSDVSNSGNRGTFTITAVVDAHTVQFTNPSGSDSAESSNGDIGWSLCTSTIIITEDLTYSDGYAPFTIDNADFRYGGDTDWGSMYVAQNVTQFITLMNGGSIRWYSTVVDGFLVVTSDGSGCWVGSIAFVGLGEVYVFPMAGCQVRTWQPAIASWTLNQPYIVYLPNNTGDWTSTPDTHHDALDQLAQRLYALEHP